MFSMLRLLTSISIICLFLACTVLGATGLTNQHLAHLSTTSGGLVTCLSDPDVHALQEAIQLTPCTLIYTFASWSGHARYLIHDREYIQNVARQYREAIESKRLAIVATQMDEPPAEGDQRWKYVINGNYWDSLAMFSSSSVQDKAAVEPTAESLALAFDACLTSHPPTSIQSESSLPKDEL
ncbi:hypothetical protein GLOTRDRAFT_92110 [Gloeophyllum trabeum ATCC 11539]|uniref:Uncharacterized protein n=1 Tax=Gloeophyllum trabeum (strain ATCC 11539 / FP-39264 / Madison 617) TaxID=670483 RepID=S7QC30_GLOTA|nr:uncharacterized protein GLOTRDRAFT_92110 [Gloeophyllum trabeum ATCC 11539]EPQ56913.1 hypothetical protein GLOTRDRAFT_92110 [Gloeophyllum trabeum ATCC 11539]